MSSPSLLRRQGQHLLQIGAALFLFTSFEGFAIPYFASPPLGRSTHSLAGVFGLILLTFGLVWPRLRLGTMAATIAFWFLVYSGFAITAAFFLAALWGAGRTIMPLAGAQLGTSLQEAVITAVSYSSGPTGIASFALILWGLRGLPDPEAR